MFNVHEVIGWFRCANLSCTAALHSDHVTLTTTTHVRRFCSVECIHEGQQAWHELIRRSDNPLSGSDVIDFMAVLHQERSS